MAALATVDQVAARVGEEITDSADILLANSVLEEASEQVRFYANQAWVTPAGVPAVVLTIVVAAAARGYQNPSGFDMERGDMVTFNRGREYVSGANLTEQEIRIVKAASRVGSTQTLGLSNPVTPVPRSRHCGPYDRGYAPMDWGENKPFPLGYW